MLSTTVARFVSVEKTVILERGRVLKHRGHSHLNLAILERMTAGELVRYEVNRDDDIEVKFSLSIEESYRGPPSI